LREGLDLPEVSLVCILDADKQGFLRSQSSLIQTMGRAARNANSLALLYADEITDEMRKAMGEVERRRVKQLAYNAEHGIIPTTIQKAIRRGIELELAAHRTAKRAAGASDDDDDESFDREELLGQMQAEMMEAAEKLEFEKAARLRDEIAKLKSLPASARPKKNDQAIRGPSKAGMPGTRAGRGRKRR
jgi:excinuclease ABC subunit B